MDDMGKDNLGGGSTDGSDSCSNSDTSTINNRKAFSDTPESYVSSNLTNRDSLLKLMSSSDKPTGEVTDTVDMDDFGGSSTDGLGFSTGDVLGHVDMNYAIHNAGLWWTGVGCAMRSYVQAGR